MTKPRVLVIGGGIGGLAAAYELTGGARETSDLDVTIVEAANSLGGKIASMTIAGRRVDLAADGFLARRPEALDLIAELGIERSLEIPGTAGASIFARGRIRRMPAKLSLGIPTQWRALARSKVLSPWALLRAGLDVVAPRHDLRGKLGDRAIGPLVEAKLGRAVVTTLVDPMLGGIHAGRVAEMSASATFPQLLAVAGNSGSLMHALRATLPPSPADGEPAQPVFNSLNQSVASLIDTLATTLRGRGVTIALSTEAHALSRNGDSWRLETSAGTLIGDAVVIALPAEPAATVVRGVDAELAGLLDTITYASVGVVTLVLNAGVLPIDKYGTGLLVPSSARRRAGTAFLTTAVTYLSTKWPHLARDGDELIRISTGKIDDLRFTELTDAALIAQVVDEVSELFGVELTPRSAHVQRWMNALPQYQVNHQLRVAGIDAAAARLGNVAFTGAAFGGVGIPACIGHGRSTALQIRTNLLGEPKS